MDIEKLEQLGRLRDAGVLTPEEFAAAKVTLLNSLPVCLPPSPSPDQGMDQTQLVSALAAALQPQPNTKTETDHAEYEVDTFRSSTRGWLLGSFSGWITLTLSIVSIIAATNLPTQESRVACFLIAATAALRIFLKWFTNISSRYELTTQRLILKTGIFLKKIDEIELFRVKDVRVDFSIINQLVGIGNITLQSSDSSANPYMRDIPRAREVRETLRSLVARERQRSRVREIDDWSM